VSRAGLSRGFLDFLADRAWEPVFEIHDKLVAGWEAERAAAEAEQRREAAEKAEIARLEAELAKVRQESEALEPRLRELAFAEAGVDIDGIGAFVARGYESDLEDHAAIRKHVVELGFVLTGGPSGLRYRLPEES
jgi:hypothetical protein